MYYKKGARSRIFHLKKQMPKKKIGRPKLSEIKYRKPGLSFRLRPGEHEEIEKAIASSGESKSEWIRDALLRKARRNKS